MMARLQDDTHTQQPNRATINVWPDFAKMFGLGKNAAYEAAKRGDFKTIRIGKRILVSNAEVARLLAGRES